MFLAKKIMSLFAFFLVDIRDNEKYDWFWVKAYIEPFFCQFIANCFNDFNCCQKYKLIS